MKLSTIWYKANRELTQIKGGMGSRSQKRACAFGAILYYDAVDKSSDNLYGYNLDDMKQAGELKFAVDKFNELACPGSGANIVTLNDWYNWSFLEFARKARKLKL